MPINTKSRAVATSSKPVGRGVASTNSKANPKPVGQQGIILPTEPSEPEYDLGSASVLIHGEEKIGKTSLIAQFPDPMFLMFEPGGRFLRIKRWPLRGQFSSWEEFTKFNDKVLLSDLYQNIVFDTVDNAYELAVNHVLTESGEEALNEGSLGYGKGVDKVDRLFKTEVLRITSTGRGVIFISHTKTQEFEQATGAKYNKLIPTMKDRARRFIKGFADISAYYGYFGSDRFLVIEGSDSLDAGHRIDGRFLTTTGKIVHAIPMGDTPQEGYENFISAFNNEQVEQNIMKRRAGLSEVKAKFAIKKR